MSRSLNRPEKSAAEVAVLLQIPPADLRQYLEGNGSELAPETLTFLLRHLSAPGLEDLRELVGRLLVGLPQGQQFSGRHCEPIIRAQARSFGLDKPSDLQEFRGACYQKMWEAIAAGAEIEPFWEERFYRALKHTVIEVGRATKRTRDSETELAAVGSDPDEPESIPDESDLQAGLLDRLTDERLLKALRTLPRGPRLAAWLRWRKGLKVESLDKSEQTVASTLGVSGSMVRRHLRAAKALLEQDPDVRDSLRAAANS